MIKINQQARGFTLIEVIIAIAIIGILFAAFSRLGNFGGAVNSAKDTKAQAFVVQIKNAVNLEYLTSGRMPNGADLRTDVVLENDIRVPDDLCVYYGYDDDNGQFMVAAVGASEWIAAGTARLDLPVGSASCSETPVVAGVNNFEKVFGPAE